MPKVRYLKIRFDKTLHPRDIPKFRAAVIEKTERVSSLFHNHIDDTKVMYRYPLIQYKLTDAKASVLCLQAGTDDIHYLLQQKDLELRIGNKNLTFEIEDVDLHFDTVDTSEQLHTYRITDWLALNQNHYGHWQQNADDETAQAEMLRRILCGNILSFAKGIEWWVESPIVVKINKVTNIRPTDFKKQRVLAFTVEFSCNVNLPNFIGLGKGVSVGFGVVEKIDNV